MPQIIRQAIDVFRLELLLQLGLATLCGGWIGLEREFSGKPAGLRTNILICVGATLFTSLSMVMSLGRGDPARVAAQILPGVGFIGAGTILHTRGSVTGLTSAATIWVVAAIGMALGARAYTEAIGTTLLVMFVLYGLGRVEKIVARSATETHLLVHARPEATMVADLESLIRRSGLDVHRTASHQENVDLVIEFDLRGPKRLHNEVLGSVVHHPGVRGVSTGE
ncbi:MAG TPA: MgtC/SapB family protein [Gemmatimonadales bacterium]|nr:MgtC/SapB family protein [Gemmatimonadales bacterium]